ncbi:preprotein translocase subunit SecG [Candidatus Margulisiibacteriota bacterium]
MKIFLLTVEFIIAVLLIISILLHTAKGEGLGGIGGHARMFSSQKGLEAGLNKITTFLAALFLSLAFLMGLFF